LFLYVSLSFLVFFGDSPLLFSSLLLDSSREFLLSLSPRFSFWVSFRRKDEVGRRWRKTKNKKRVRGPKGTVLENPERKKKNLKKGINQGRRRKKKKKK